MRNSLPSLKPRSEEHTSELQSRENLVCRLLLEKKNPAMAATSGDLPPVMIPIHLIIRRTARHPPKMTTVRLPPPLPAEPCFFFFNDPATTEIYTLSLHDALPISGDAAAGAVPGEFRRHPSGAGAAAVAGRSEEHTSELQSRENLVCRLLLEK